MQDGNGFMTVKEAALACVERLKTVGWLSCGRESDADGPRCAILTVVKSTGGFANNFTARNAMYDRLKAKLHVYDIVDIFRWNDAPGRTAEEVIAVFEQIAQEAE